MLRLARYTRYNASPKGKARSTRYEASAKGRERVERYRCTGKGILARTRADLNQARSRHADQLDFLLAELAALDAERPPFTAEDIAEYLAANKKK